MAAAGAGRCWEGDIDDVVTACGRAARGSSGRREFIYQRASGLPRNPPTRTQPRDHRRFISLRPFPKQPPRLWLRCDPSARTHPI